MNNENELTASLAQSLKAAAGKATPGNWRAFQYHDGRCGVGGGHNAEIMVCEHISKERQHDAMFLALASPANILTLVEALEKAQQVDEELCKLLPPGVEYMDPPDGGDVTLLEGVRRMVADYRQRIADLESRTVTVKLPPHAQENLACCLDGYETWLIATTFRDTWNKCLDEVMRTGGAGIKWEAE